MTQTLQRKRPMFKGLNIGVPHNCFAHPKNFYAPLRAGINIEAPPNRSCRSVDVSTVGHARQV
eukprot:1022874-Amphidinium_carterae.1